MKKLYWSGILCCFLQAGFAQAIFNNNGADIHVTNGGYMIVKSGSSGLPGSLYNTLGSIDNQGTIVVEQDLKNDASITGLGDTIKVQGDWINNNAYAGSNSWVDLYGGAQLITGTSVTTFNNLNLGGNGVVKRQTLNAKTTALLKLNDAELATDANEMWVTNTNNNAITWNNGFASSLAAGHLARSTDNTAAYIFPMGSPSSLGTSIFRPVQMAPASSAANVYGACLVKGDATVDGYDTNTYDSTLCRVNPNFYHRLYQITGTDAVGLTMFFDPSGDGDWTNEAHWKNALWNNIGTGSIGSSLGFTTVTVSGVSDFVPEPFALARKKFKINAGPDYTINTGQSVTIRPASGVPTGASYNWTPDDGLSCTTCETPVANPDGTTDYILRVVDPAGCTASDTIRVTVNNGNLLIPTAFSPNGDGKNDLFHVLNKNITKVNLQVFNRWGEKVYESEDPYDGWDGTFKGMEQEMGVYVWQCTYMVTGDTTNRVAKGNVTLVR